MTDVTSETTIAVAKPSVRAALLTAAIVSTGTLLLATFELSMAEWPSAFVLLGILPLTALIFFGCCVWTATLLFRIRKGGAKFAVPFLICAATLALLVYAPLQKVALQRILTGTAPIANGSWPASKPANSSPTSMPTNQ